MNEAIQKRILKLEMKINPHSLETFDLIGTVKAIGIERNRLEELSPFELEEELKKDPKTLIIRAAKTGFLNRNDQLGMVQPLIPQTPKDPNMHDWIQTLMAARKAQ